MYSTLKCHAHLETRKTDRTKQRELMIFLHWCSLKEATFQLVDQINKAVCCFHNGSIIADVVISLPAAIRERECCDTGNVHHRG